MLPDSFADKFIFASVIMSVALVFAVGRGIWGLASGSSKKRDRASDTRTDEELPSPEPDRTSGFGRRRTAGSLLSEASAPDSAPPAQAAPAAEPAPPANPLAGMDAATLLQKFLEDNAPPPPHEGPLPPAIEAARWRPIVFRPLKPKGPGADGLSFYGGEPIGPAGFVWPRSRGSEGKPLSFVMQWDCAQLAAQDVTGLLPANGVLYCFLDLDWGESDGGGQGHCFLHHAGPTDGWEPIAVPADARPLFGTNGAYQMSGCSNLVDNAADHVPRILPRLPFAPVAFNYPAVELDEEEGEQLFWGDKWAAEPLLAVQEAGGDDGGPIRDIDAPRPEFARPFPAFPHDFGAIRVLAAAILDETRNPRPQITKLLLPDLSEEERSARFAMWHDEAKELFALGCQRPVGTPIEQQIADDVWRWAEERQALLRFGFDGLVVRTVNLSLGVDSKALDRVPEEWIDKAMQVHALASEYMANEGPDHSKPGGYEEWRARQDAGELKRGRNVHAPTPAHMFGPPSYVQGYVEELVDDHLLLLELTNCSGPEHHFGEGVLQYLITPDDLAAGRFDKVKSVLSGY